MSRGRLRIYLGASPGVGTTHAMLAEGLRRAGRGTDVVIGVLAATDRPSLNELAATLERLPTADGELDLAAATDRTPQVLLVDELAHRAPSGIGRWTLVEAILESGVDVITTVHITEVESLHDVIAGITGMPPAAMVPDAVLLAAEQIELIDMTPEALRRRLAHGHIVPPERLDPALANQYRPAVLGALRQLALLWLAERVEEHLERQLHVSADAAEIRERVVVALTGIGGDRLVRRAARLAGRTGADLVGVHVVTSARQPGPDLELQRQLVIGLGGTYREVVGDDVAAALAGFARVEQATQVVLGSTGGRRNDVVDRLIERIGTADVHLVTTDTSPPAGRMLASPTRSWTRSRHHLVAAWTVCLVGLPLLTGLLSAFDEHVSLGSALLLDLCLVLTVAALGGILPGLAASIIAFALTNWFLTPPLHTLAVNEGENVVALTVFVIVTVVIGVLVDRAARRSREAATARAEAGALARSAATLVGAHDPLPDLLEQMRATFGLASASVLERTDSGWWPTHVSGSPELLTPADGTSLDLSPDGSLRLVVAGGALGAEQLEVLRAFADQLTMAVEARRLRAEAAEADLLAETDALRAALLQAVSHDFRTPLATIKASASGLLESGVEFSAADREQLLLDIDGAVDRLDRMVRDLLDMSRLQAGAVDLALRPTALEDVVAAALAGIPAAHRRVDVDVSEELPMALADPALLERALANLVSNAVAWSPPDVPVRVVAGAVGDSIDLRVVDRGPGVAPADRDRIFVPFQRLGDRSNDAGAGLGLAIAKGFVEAMGSRLDLDETPGGGLTITIRLLIAEDAA